MTEDRIAIVALVPLTYAGQAYAVGERLHVKPLEAAAFVTYQHKARFAEEGDAPAPPAEPNGRRRYKRRDLVAES